MKRNALFVAAAAAIRFPITSAPETSTGVPAAVSAFIVTDRLNAVAQRA